MKHILIVIFLLPSLAFSQHANNAFSIMGGGEYQDAHTHAWDIEFNYNRRLLPAPKWSAELGLNYSILEYKGNSERVLDHSFDHQLFGPNGGPYHILKQSAHYSKTTAVRVQIGLNYRIFDKANWNLSAGLHFVNEIQLYTYEHGQQVLVPLPAYADTLEVLDTHYSKERHPFRTGENAITIQLQPHLDLSTKLTTHLWFTSRAGYYARLGSTLKHSRAQLLVGLRYEW